MTPYPGQAYGPTTWQQAQQPAPPDPKRHMIPLGVANLVVSGLLAVLIGYRALASLLATALDAASRKLLPGNVPPEVAKLADEVTGTMKELANLELLSLIPLGLCGMVLFVLAIGVLMKRLWALKGTLVWAAFAIFAGLTSIALQVIYLAPALRDLEQKIAKLVSTAGTPTIVAPTLVRTVIPALALLLWAIVALAWGWYLDRKIADAAHGSASPPAHPGAAW